MDLENISTTVLVRTGNRGIVMLCLNVLDNFGSYCDVNPQVSSFVTVSHTNNGVVKFHHHQVPPCTPLYPPLPTLTPPDPPYWARVGRGGAHHLGQQVQEEDAVGGGVHPGAAR